MCIASLFVYVEAVQNVEHTWNFNFEITAIIYKYGVDLRFQSSLEIWKQKKFEIY